MFLMFIWVEVMWGKGTDKNLPLVYLRCVRFSLWKPYLNKEIIRNQEPGNS